RRRNGWSEGGAFLESLKWRGAPGAPLFKPSRASERALSAGAGAGHGDRRREVSRAGRRVSQRAGWRGYARGDAGARGVVETGVVLEREVDRRAVRIAVRERDVLALHHHDHRNGRGRRTLREPHRVRERRAGAHAARERVPRRNARLLIERRE